MSEKNEFLDSPVMNKEKKLQDDEELSEKNNEENEENQNNNSGIEPEKEKLLKKKSIPKEKNEIIKHLIERLNAAEDAINDAHEALIKEEEKRKIVMKELDEKTKTLNELIKSENESIQTKVQNEFKKTLNAAVSAKVQAENQKNDLESLLIEKNYLIQEFDDLNIHFKKNYYDLSLSYENLERENQEMRDIIAALQTEKETLLHNIEQKNNEIDGLQNELSEAKGTMQKLSDVQNVLNRILGSQDLLTKKEQQNLGIYKKQEIKSNDSPIIQKVDDKKNYLNNDDDFWYSGQNENGGEGKMDLNIDKVLNKMGQGNNKSYGEVNRSANSINQSKDNDSKLLKKK